MDNTIHADVSLVLKPVRLTDAARVNVDKYFEAYVLSLQEVTGFREHLPIGGVFVSLSEPQNGFFLEKENLFYSLTEMDLLSKIIQRKGSLVLNPNVFDINGDRITELTDQAQKNDLGGHIDLAKKSPYFRSRTVFDNGDSDDSSNQTFGAEPQISSDHKRELEQTVLDLGINEDLNKLVHLDPFLLDYLHSLAYKDSAFLRSTKFDKIYRQGETCIQQVLHFIPPKNLTIGYQDYAKLIKYCDGLKGQPHVQRDGGHILDIVKPKSQKYFLCALAVLAKIHALRTRSGLKDLLRFDEILETFYGIAGDQIFELAEHNLRLFYPKAQSLNYTTLNADFRFIYN